MTLPLIWQIVFWTWVASEVFIAIATRTMRSTGKIEDRGSMVLLWVAIVAALTAGIWMSEAIPPNMLGGTRSLKLIGLIVLIIALAIRWTAIFTLGKFFSSNVAILDSQTLNRSGLYSIIRHPSYLGLLLVFLAVALHSRNWFSFVIILVPTTAAVLYRIHVEESALRQAFGADYAACSQTTKRLIPGIY